MASREHLHTCRRTQLLELQLAYRVVNNYSKQGNLCENYFIVEN